MLTDESRIRARVFDVIRRIVDIPVETRVKEIRKDWLKPPEIWSFKGIDPYLLYAGTDGWVFHPSDCTPDIVWPLNVCFVGQADGPDSLQVHKFKSISTKEARGFATRFSPFMVRRDVGMADRGRFLTASALHVFLGGKWVNADAHRKWKANGSEAIFEPEHVKANELDGPAVAIGLALRQRYEWAVHIGFSNCPSVRIVTDPTGMKELFRLRDVPDGRDKRDALMTWVSDHWRKDRADADMETYVRKHLRGSTKFEWRGMECEIVPSQYDVDQRNNLIAEREAMRLAGTDKREAPPNAA